MAKGKFVLISMLLKKGVFEPVISPRNSAWLPFWYIYKLFDGGNAWFILCWSRYLDPAFVYLFEECSYIQPGVKQLWYACAILRFNTFKSQSINWGYLPITYFWTGLIILHHSYLVGNLTNSKNAERKSSKPLKFWHFCISNFRTC